MASRELVPTQLHVQLLCVNVLLSCSTMAREVAWLRSRQNSVSVKLLLWMLYGTIASCWLLANVCCVTMSVNKEE